MSLVYEIDNKHTESSAEYMVNDYVYNHSKVETDNGKMRIIP